MSNAKQCTGDVRYNPVTAADGSVTVTVSGQLADGCSSQTYLSLLDHATYTAGAVRAIWQELGGTIQGRDIQAPVPKDAKVLARAFSPDLAEIIRDLATCPGTESTWLHPAGWRNCRRGQWFHT